MILLIHHVPVKLFNEEGMVATWLVANYYIILTPWHGSIFIWDPTTSTTTIRALECIKEASQGVPLYLVLDYFHLVCLDILLGK